MSKLKLEIPKGTRDFSPKDKIIRDKVINDIKEIFEIYGFNPLETPTFEKLEVLNAKSGAGQDSDVISEMYTFKDQGNRELGLRFEFTVPLARYIGQYQQTIKMPFTRYQIGTVFRDGPIKLGRYREFYQCDVDVVGISDVIADAQMLAIAKDVFKKLDLETTIELNNRKLLNDILEYCEFDSSKISTVLISIDKLDKIKKEGVIKELVEKGIDTSKAEKVLSIIDVTGSNTEKLNKIKEVIGEDSEGVQELEKMFNYLKEFNVNNFDFIPSLVRGQAYYTGPIYEVFLKDRSIVSSSIAGGGRWDSMISKFLGNNNTYPATGISFGIEPIMDIINKREENTTSTVADLFVIPIKTREQCISLVQKLREQNLKVVMDLNNKSISKNLDYANKLGFPFVAFIGDTELKENKIKIRDMKTGDEKLVNVEDIKTIIK